MEVVTVGTSIVELGGDNCTDISIQADPSNTANIYLKYDGSSDVLTTSNGQVLVPGGIFIENNGDGVTGMASRGGVQAISTAAGQKVRTQGIVAP